jgi:hypothetical protein
MKAAAVGPILLLRVDDNPLPCQQQGAKVLNRCIENAFTSLVLPSIRKFFFAAIGSFDRSDNDRLAAKQMFLIDTE